jgi:hypothetical protein
MKMRLCLMTSPTMAICWFVSLSPVLAFCQPGGWVDTQPVVCADTLTH